MSRSVQFRSQEYRPFWPAVLVSERAQSRIDEFTILYSRFPQALQQTLLSLFSDSSAPSESIAVAEIVPMDDVPSGLKVSYSISPKGLMVCDLWTPLQPQLFGIQPISKPKKKRPSSD